MYSNSFDSRESTPIGPDDPTQEKCIPLERTVESPLTKAQYFGPSQRRKTGFQTLDREGAHPVAIGVASVIYSDTETGSVLRRLPS